MLLGCRAGVHADPPADPTVAIEEALLAEDYRRVIRLSEAAGDAPGGESAFYRGVAHLELGDARAAAVALREYLRFGGAFTEEARVLLLQVEEDAATTLPRRVRYLVQTGVVYDSRVIVSDEAPPFFREVDDLAAGVNLAVDLDPAPWLRMRYRSYWLQYLEWSEAARWDQSLSMGIRGTTLGGDYELTLVGESWLRDYRPVFWRAGTRGELAWLVAKDRVVWTAIEAGRDWFPESEAFDGVYASVALGYEQYFRRGSLLWDLFGQRHDAEEDPLRFNEIGAGVASSYRISTRWSGGLGARVSRLAYDEVDPVLGAEQDDTYFSSRAWLSFSVNHAVSVLPSVVFITNDSNVDLADYDRYIASLSLVWSRW